MEIHLLVVKLGSDLRLRATHKCGFLLSEAATYAGIQIKLFSYKIYIKNYKAMLNINVPCTLKLE